MPQRRKIKPTTENIVVKKTNDLFKLPMADVVRRDIEQIIDSDSGELIAEVHTEIQSIERGRFVLMYIDYISVLMKLNEKSLKIMFAILDYLMYGTNKLNINYKDYSKIMTMAGIKSIKTFYKYKNELEHSGVIVRRDEGLFLNEHLFWFGKKKTKKDYIKNIKTYQLNTGSNFDRNLLERNGE